MTRPALDRIPEHDLLAMPAADALAKIAVWLEDCDDHVARGRPGGLPAPPFKLSDAWVVARLIAEVRCNFTFVADSRQNHGARR